MAARNTPPGKQQRVACRGAEALYAPLMIPAAYRTRLTLALTTGLAVLPAMADAPRPAPLPKVPPVPVQAYGDKKAECLEWTNGCVLCRKDEDGKIHCSTPGIACQPEDIICKASPRK